MIDRIKKIFETFRKWLKKRPVNIAIASVVFLTMVIGLVLFFKFVFPTLLGIAVIIFFLLPSRPITPPQQRTPFQIVIGACLVDVVNAIHHDIAVKPINPEREYEILGKSFINSCGVKLVQLFLTKKNQNTGAASSADEEQKEIIIQRLQSEINSRLRLGKVFGVPYGFFNNEAIITIVSGIDLGTHYRLDCAFVDNAQAEKHVKDSRRPSRPIAIPTDNEF
ncbi:MAG: hypothetical protein LBR74_02925 [Eubacterium sp.]|nr:hypothetical protein [Eubacterium sp.]